jgi:cell division septation protein DedD
MNQDDMPAPAVVDEVKAVADEEITVVEYVPPASPRPVETQRPAPPKHAAPDPFAVGVRVLKMAPAWLLFTTVCCSGVVLALGWMRTGGDAAAVAPPRHNDARAAKHAPAAEGSGAKTEAAAATASLAVGSGQKSTAANDAPAQASAPQPTPPPAPAAPPKTEEKPRVETPAPVVDSGAKFTAQVGSFNNQSEANARVSALRAAGFEAHVAAAELPGRGTWYRVQVGRFADRGEASKTAAALRAKGAATAALVVPLQK